MDEQAKKQLLRMIPYGLYVMTAASGDEQIGAGTVNWVTQASFRPPLIAAGVKADSGLFAALKASGHFALNVLGKGQGPLAFTFFKPAERDGMKLSGEPFEFGRFGSPVLENCVGFMECAVREVVELGDHAVVVAEVVDAALHDVVEGRLDAATLWLKDLGDNIYYGG